MDLWLLCGGRDGAGFKAGALLGFGVFGWGWLWVMDLVGGFAGVLGSVLGILGICLASVVS